MLEAQTNSDWADRIDETAAVPVVPSRRHHVSAIVVSHNGQRWLPATLRGLAAQTRAVDAVTAVDTGSQDESAETLTRALGQEALVVAPDETPFGNAVSRGFARVHDQGAQSNADASWIWLLHDDAAPAPDALEELLATADARPDAGVIGPKIVGWHDHSLLMEIGLSVTGGGRRETFLERHEHDQGQHDNVRDVLAVGSPGMLIRRDVWEGLGGFDHNLPMFRDDLDFCMRARRAGWSVVFCGNAMLYHAEAGAHGRRELHAVFDRPHMIDRLSAIHLVLIHWPLWLLPILVLRMLIGSVGRIVSFLLGRDALAAADEIAGWGLALARLGRVVESRRSLRSIATLSRARALRPYLPTAADAWRHASDVIGEVVDLATEGQQFTAGAGVRHTPTSPLRQLVGDDVEQALIDTPDVTRHNILVRWLRRPSVSAAVILIVGAFIGERALFGTGVLHGGALLPVPDRASTLWTYYFTEWHDVGLGSTLQAPPYLVVVAALSLLFGGAVSFTVTALLVLAVPLSAISAMWALKPWIQSAIVRAAAGVTYALLPAVTGAAVTGRVGTVVLATVLPWIARSWLTIISAELPSWRRIWATTLLMALATSFVPIVWVTVALFLAVVHRRIRSRITAVVVPMVGSLLLLLPWSLRLVTEPWLWINEAGRTSPFIVDRQTSALDIAVLNPGGPGTAYTAVIVACAAAIALTRKAVAPQVRSLWIGALIPFGIGMLQTFVTDTWSGPATLMAGAALILAIAFAADGLGLRLSRMSFTFNHIVVGALTIALALSTGLAWFLWLRGSSVVSREPNVAVPAFVQADLLSEERPRAVVMRRDSDGSIRYEIVSGSGPVLGDADVLPSHGASIVEQAISDLAAGRGGQEMRELAAFGIRYVVMPDNDAELESRLDAAAGLRRLAGDSSGALWESAYPTTRLRLVPSLSKEGVAVTSGDRLPPVTGTEPSVLFAQENDQGWVATLDGQILPITTSEFGTVQWSLPGTFAGSSLVITRDGGGHAVALLMQGLLVAFVVVLSLPRRRQDDPEGQSEHDFLVGEP